MASLAFVSRPAWITVVQLLITTSDVERSPVQARQSWDAGISAARAGKATTVRAANRTMTRAQNLGSMARYLSPASLTQSPEEAHKAAWAELDAHPPRLYVSGWVTRATTHA